MFKIIFAHTTCASALGGWERLAKITRTTNATRATLKVSGVPLGSPPQEARRTRRALKKGRGICVRVHLTAPLPPLPSPRE